jgi:hypothetical protein
MVANILKSPRAVAMSVYVVRAFVKMRQDVAARLAYSAFYILHSPAPPPQPPKPEIGFHVKEDAASYRTRRRAKTQAEHLLRVPLQRLAPPQCFSSSPYRPLAFSV